MNMKKLIESIDKLSETTNVTDYNPPSQGGTRSELLAKFKKTNDPKDAEKARKAGATQKELQDARKGIAEDDNGDLDARLNSAVNNYNKKNAPLHKPNRGAQTINKLRSGPDLESIQALTDQALMKYYKDFKRYYGIDDSKGVRDTIVALKNEIKRRDSAGSIEGIAEGFAETLPMDDAEKVLRQYGADNFKTTSNELHFYKNGRPMSVDLIWNDDATRSVNLSQLNSAGRKLKGQGMAEGAKKDMSKEVKAMATGKCPHCHGPVKKKEHPTLTQYHCAKCGIRGSIDKQGVAEGYFDKDEEDNQLQMDATRRGRLNRERGGSDKIDAMLRQQNDKLAQYNQTGKFWLKQKDTQEHLSDSFTGKEAANQAARDLLKQRPELKGNLLITAYGPGEKQGVAEGGYPEVDHMPGPIIKRTQTGCKRCHGKGYVYKTPDGQVHPTNQPDAKKYKCGKCSGIGFVKVTEEQGVAEAGNKPLEPHFGMGDSRTPRELKTQMRNASDEFVKRNTEKVGPMHTKVAKMQNKLAKSELRRRDDHSRIATGINESKTKSKR